MTMDRKGFLGAIGGLAGALGLGRGVEARPPKPVSSGHWKCPECRDIGSLPVDFGDGGPERAARNLVGRRPWTLISDRPAMDRIKRESMRGLGSSWVPAADLGNVHEVPCPYCTVYEIAVINPFHPACVVRMTPAELVTRGITGFPAAGRYTFRMDRGEWTVAVFTTCSPDDTMRIAIEPSVYALSAIRPAR